MPRGDSNAPYRSLAEMASPFMTETRPMLATAAADAAGKGLGDSRIMPAFSATKAGHLSSPDMRPTVANKVVIIA